MAAHSVSRRLYMRAVPYDHVQRALYWSRRDVANVCFPYCRGGTIYVKQQGLFVEVKARLTTRLQYAHLLRTIPVRSKMRHTALEHVH